MNCIFCAIISGEIPSAKVYEDEKIFAFKDIKPQAPVHVLVIPKEHIEGIDKVTADTSAVVAHIFSKINGIALAAGASNGYRVISNCGEDGVQTVRHLHFHILGGKKLAEMLN